VTSAVEMDTHGNRPVPNEANSAVDDSDPYLSTSWTVESWPRSRTRSADTVPDTRKALRELAAGHEEPPSLFRRWTMAELLAEPSDFEWCVEGWLAQPTYGQIAGEMKTLKSYLAGFLAVGVASGLPIFGRFSPRVARPVAVFVGEGGRKLYTRRIRRICAAMGTDVAEIDLHPTFEVAPISSLTFQDSLRRDLDELEPALVIVDPLYTYHGTKASASDLHQEGALLNQLSGPCMERETSLQVVNHYNQTGSGTGLKRITMAGSGEWADSWMLVSHREVPDVDGGIFRLTLDIGSRQWGGTTWDLDLSIGRFDEDTMSHDGEITWDLNRASASSTKQDKGDAKQATAKKAILDVLADCPWEKTRTAIRDLVAGNHAVFDQVFDDLAENNIIGHSERKRPEGGTTKKRLLWGILTTTPAQLGQGWPEDVD
jgi:hypothetical protein